MIKTCSKCKTDKDESEFYFQKSRNRVGAWCKICLNSRTLNKQRQNKREMIEILGGKCSHCGLVDHDCVYDFHHVDPSEKEVGFTNFRNLTLGNERLIDELKKCVLLCANCHRKVHVKY